MVPKQLLGVWNLGQPLSAREQRHWRQAQLVKMWKSAIVEQVQQPLELVVAPQERRQWAPEVPPGWLEGAQ